jgi:hypothetical protein
MVSQIASAFGGAMPATGAGRYLTPVNTPAPNAMTVIIQPRTRRAHVPELFNFKLELHNVKVEFRGYFFLFYNQAAGYRALMGRNAS